MPDNLNEAVVAMTVRVDPELRRQIEAAARDSFRTLSGEAACRLKRSFERQLEQASA